MSIYLSAIIQALLAIFYVAYIDRFKPEPWKNLIKAVCLGMLSCFPALLLEMAFGPLLNSTPAGNAASAGIFEEASKMLALWLVLRKNVAFDEHVDGIVYAVCVAIGFTFLENIEYFLMDPTCVDMRVLMPGHYIFAILMGLFVSKSHFAKGAAKRSYMFLAFLAPAFVHWLWDYILMASEATMDSGVGAGYVTVFFLFYLTSIMMTIRVLRRQEKEDAAAREAARLAEIERIKREAVEEYIRQQVAASNTPKLDPPTDIQ